MSSKKSAERITLKNIDGFSRLSGEDENGCCWVEFEVDYFAEGEDGECSICGRRIASGWMCLDGGEEVCDKHLKLPKDFKRQY